MWKTKKRNLKGVLIFNPPDQVQSIISTKEDDILPGDKRLATSPEEQNASKRVAMYGGESFELDSDEISII